MRLTKRSGSIEVFDATKIKRALLLAFNACGKVPNVAPLVVAVMTRLRETSVEQAVTVNDVQDATEQVLLEAGHTTVAHAYIKYRMARDAARAQRRVPDKWALPSYIHAGKYARHQDKLGRREVYSETTDRVGLMHWNRLVSINIVEGDYAGELLSSEALSLDPKTLGFEFLNAISAVHNKDILPSMRSMQFAGSAILADNARMYNCSYTLIDRWEVFSQIFYLLLCGCGVGYSVQWQHIECLSIVNSVDRSRVVHHTVADSIVGWADAVGALVQSFQSGEWIEFNYSLIRSEGSVLVTSGGLAPGHLPLRECLEALRALFLNAAGRRLRPLEASDAICHMATAVLAGGIRRSSLIGLFSSHDTEMMYSKARGQYRPAVGSDPGLNAWRAMVNISAALLRGSVHRSVFDRLIRIAEENFGDPGFIFLNDLDDGTNPCSEIGMRPVLDASDFSKYLDRKVSESTLDASVILDSFGSKAATGFSFCNLCEINMATVTSREDFLSRCAHAALLGTIQASYTSFPYLGPVTEAICQRDALLGVGLTGMQDNREFSFDASLLRAGAAIVRSTNERWSRLLGINAAARLTTVKPSGTGSLELGCVGSGIHNQWARRYFRGVLANANEPVAQEFRRVNPHMVETKANGDWFIRFPIECSESVRVVRDTTAMEFLDDVLLVYDNWVVPGTMRGELTHNVSCTVTLRPGEKADVLARLWKRRDSLAAMSFVPLLIDVKFPYAPLRAVVSAEDEALWDHLIENYRPVDWTLFKELSDTTALRESIACSGGVCDI